MVNTLIMPKFTDSRSYFEKEPKVLLAGFGSVPSERIHFAHPLLCLLLLLILLPFLSWCIFFFLFLLLRHIFFVLRNLGKIRGKSFLISVPSEDMSKDLATILLQFL